MVGHSANKFKYQNAKRKMTEENSKMASLGSSQNPVASSQ